MTRRHQVSLTGRDGTGNTASLLIDGHDISNTVTSLRLDISARHEHRLTLNLAAFPLDAHLEGVVVQVCDDIADVLQRLGWTPPPEEKEDSADVLD